jgi:hypothetical protein
MPAASAAAAAAALMVNGTHHVTALLLYCCGGGGAPARGSAKSVGSKRSHVTQAVRQAGRQAGRQAAATTAGSDLPRHRCSAEADCCTYGLPPCSRSYYMAVSPHGSL